MQVSTILDIAIIAIPTCYAALVAVQFASGLARLGKRPVAPVTTPIAPVEPQGATVEVKQIPDAIESEGYCPNVVAPIAVSITSIAPESTAATPAFIPNPDEPEYSDADRALVDATTLTIAQYWQAVPTHNIIPFVRPVRATQKPQQQHPALEGMNLRELRKLGTSLKIRNAARWNRATAIEILTRHYSNVA